MSSERQEPGISLNLDDEDIIERAPAAKRGKSAPPPPPPGNAPGSGGSGGFLVFLGTVLILGLAGVSYYLFDQLQATQALLAQSQSRLDNLEQRLSVTDDSVTESSASMKVKLSELDSEVRKLWDNVWKKQKEELGKHDTEIDKLQKSLVSMESRIKSSQAELAAAMKTFSTDKSRLTELSGRLDKAAAQAEVNRKQLLEYGKQLTSGGSLDARVSSVERQLQQNQDWLDSINAFRRQVNRDIESLRTTVSQYHSSSPPVR